MTDLIKPSKKEALESSMYYLSTRQAFYAAMLQELNISFTHLIPTAALQYDKRKEEFKILLNEEFFCSMTLEERIAVLSHEILHFTHGHPFRSFSKAKTDDPLKIDENTRKLMNIAQDMSINQYIANLPDGCVKVEDYKLDNGQDFPKFRSWEEYYDLLKRNKNKTNQDALQRYGAGDKNDIHDFDFDSLTEEEKQELLKQAQKIFKRTIDKCSTGHTQIPGYVQDIFEKIESQITGLNYKKILQQVVKRTISVSDRSYKWNRPNRRYGNYAPGSTNGEIPKVTFYIDTSGSISHSELNQFLTVMDGLLKVGQKKCDIALWHTDLYHKQKYRVGMKGDQLTLQTGGTDINCIIQDMNRNPSDLIVVLTDGYFGEVENKLKGQIIWMISKGGTKDHSAKNIGVTIPLDKVLDK